MFTDSNDKNIISDSGYVTVHLSVLKNCSIGIVSVSNVTHKTVQMYVSAKVLEGDYRVN